MSVINSRWRWVILAFVLALTAVAVAIGSLKPSSDVALTNLNKIDELRTRFNNDKGKVRLVLLLSPT